MRRFDPFTRERGFGGFRRPHFGNQRTWGGFGSDVDPRHQYYDRSPRDYRRSDARIREDTCDELAAAALDAGDIEVTVNRKESSLMKSWNEMATDRMTGPTWINLLLGLWLIASPWIYGFFGGGVPAAWNAIIVGILITLVAGARLGSQTFDGAQVSWINVVLGAWMIASPFIYGYAPYGPFTANSIIVGVIVLFLALIATPTEPYRYGSRSDYAPWGYSPYWWGRPPMPYGWESGEGGDLRGRGPRNFQRSDERIKELVCERMAESPQLDASDIEVNVSGGTVNLQGSVPSRFGKRLAEDLAESIAGVRDVRNELRITGAPAREAPRRIA